MSHQSSPLPKQSRQDAVKAKREKALQGQLEKIRTKLADWNRGDVLGRHGIGKLVREVCSQEHKYGIGAVEQIAREIGYRDKWVYGCLQVAEAWSEREIQHILKQRDAKRFQQLSWSHLLKISQVHDPMQRNAWITRTLEEGLTVRELQSALHPEPAADDESAEEAGSTVRFTLRWLSDIKAVAESSISKQRQWEAALFPSGGTVLRLSSLNKRDREATVNAAIEALEAARKGYEVLIEQLRSAMQESMAKAKVR
jgi:hypothetical protein